MRSARSFQSSFTARSSPMIIRARPRAATSAKRPQSAPEGTTFAPTWQRAVSRPLSANAVNRPSRRRATSSRKTRSTGSSAQNARIWSSFASTGSCTAVIVAQRIRRQRAAARNSERGLTDAGQARRPLKGHRKRCPWLGLPSMPIHIRAETGDYADACLLPGDPLRAQYVAETYFDDPVQRNHERGLLGYTGTWEGKPISVQATGMGCPSAAIVMEELIQLDVKRFIRVGTCGGLQPDMKLGELIVALTAVPADRTVETYVGHEPHCPTASWELVHGAVHAAKEIGQEMRVGPIVSSDVFYNPDGGQYERWSRRGMLAVEMEAAVLFTLGALRNVDTAALLTVSDVVVKGEFQRISDDELRAAVDRMTRVALATATASPH